MHTTFVKSGRLVKKITIATILLITIIIIINPKTFNTNQIERTGENEPTTLWTFETSGNVRSSPALGDVDGDGRLEVIIGSGDYRVYALNGEDGSLLWTYETGGRIMSSPALSDLDRDYVVEIVVGSYDSRLYVLDMVGLRGFSFRVYWPCFHGDFYRSGNLYFIDRDGDFLSIWDEQYYGTDPLNPDSDGDGLVMVTRSLLGRIL